MLFNFILRPLEEVQPWGDDKPKLHWFGLTDGWCWWNVGSQQLFRYSQAQIDRWAAEYPTLTAEPSYVDYPVVRPWEDLLDRLRCVLDPVPDDLIERTHDAAKWQHLQDAAFAWADKSKDNRAWDLHTEAFYWWANRRWDAGYLRCPPNIELWTQGDTFHIRWDNRDLIDDGAPVWEATAGEVIMPVAEFVEECKSFNDRLMAAMAERVEAVTSGVLGPDIEIDLVYLAREQSDRATWMENALTLGQLKEDWEEVRKALATLEQMCYNNGVEGL